MICFKNAEILSSLSVEKNDYDACNDVNTA